MDFFPDCMKMFSSLYITLSSFRLGSHEG
uniref:Uncharacterized protein n=1 Tax=Anguilla anguilla TaxID=7936 RepID=A0A0E9XQR0_ANGAN